MWGIFQCLENNYRKAVLYFHYCADRYLIHKRKEPVWEVHGTYLPWEYHCPICHNHWYDKGRNTTEVISVCPNCKP